MKSICLFTQEEIKKDNEAVQFFIGELAIIEMIRREKTPHIQKPIVGFKSTNELRSSSFTDRKEIIKMITKWSNSSRESWTIWS